MYRLSFLVVWCNAFLGLVSFFWGGGSLWINMEVELFVRNASARKMDIRLYLNKRNYMYMSVRCSW